MEDPGGEEVVQLIKRLELDPSHQLINSKSQSLNPLSEMDDSPIDKIQISGATLASLLHRASASPADCHGLLFGHTAVTTPNPHSDDDPASAGIATPITTATITSFISLPSHFNLPIPPTKSSGDLIGWFSSRRKTLIRPSLKDSITARTLCSSPSINFAPSLYLLLTTPIQDQVTHTHEYKAFQYRLPGASFEPRSLSIVNIGPSFRSQYDSFTPNAPFPLMDFELNGPDSMVEDEENETLAKKMRNLTNQKQLDKCAEGFEISRMNRLTGSQAANYTAELEDLYEKMLNKTEGLARLVEQSSAKVLEQEKYNMKLRNKLAGLE